MFSLISKYKKLIIGAIVVILLFVGYGVFFSGEKNNTDGNLTKQPVAKTTGGSSDPSAPGKQFVTQLLAIQNIRFNLDFFNDPAYTYLQDSSKELTPQVVGRDNPFAPIDPANREGRSATGDNPLFVNTSDDEASTTPSKATPTKTSTSTKSTTSTGGTTRK